MGFLGKSRYFSRYAGLATYLAFIFGGLMGQQVFASSESAQPQGHIFEKPLPIPVIRTFVQVLESHEYALDLLPVKDRKLVFQHAAEISDFSKGRLSSVARKALISRCQKNELKDSAKDNRPVNDHYSVALCPWVLQESSVKKKISKISNGRFMNDRQIANEIKFGGVGSLSKVDKKSLRRGLNKISNVEQLRALITKLSMDEACSNPELYLQVALRLEDDFPEPTLIRDATTLFKRAVKCAKEGDEDIQEKAAYRAGLLSVWQKDFDGAQSSFRLLAEDTGNDYTTRSVYWMRRIAKERKDSAGNEKWLHRLQNINPLSFHLLASEDGQDPGLWQKILANESDPELLDSPMDRPEIYARFRIFEALLKLREQSLVSRLLRQFEKMGQWKLQGAERLPVALYSLHADDPVFQFRWMDLAFRENNSVLTRPMLRAFFPLKRFDTIESKNKDDRVDPYLVSALIRQESGFHESARSHVGAIGLMQLMPYTARLFTKVSRRKLYDPGINVEVGSKYLRTLIDRFDGDIELALASYNAGPGKIDSWVRRYPVQDRILFLDLIPFAETRKYVTLINRNYYWYLQLYAKQESVRNGFRGLASVRSVENERKKK